MKFKLAKKAQLKDTKNDENMEMKSVKKERIGKEEKFTKRSREFASLDSKRGRNAYPTPLERRILNNQRQAEMTKNLNLFSERNALRQKAFSFKDPIKVRDIKNLNNLNTAKETTRATLKDKAAFEQKYNEEKQNIRLNIYGIKESLKMS